MFEPAQIDTSDMTIADIAKMFTADMHVHYDGDLHAIVRDGQ